MNIFVLDLDKDICAQSHCDKHVVKMVVESAQMLCTMFWRLGVYNERNTYYEMVHNKRVWYYIPNNVATPRRIYARTHEHHPCVSWLCDSLLHAVWLRDMARSLCTEYTYRFHKEHATKQVLDSLPIPTLSNPSTPNYFPLAISDDLRQGMTVATPNMSVMLYRAYYIMKPIKMEYTLRSKPEWLSI